MARISTPSEVTFVTVATAAIAYVTLVSCLAQGALVWQEYYAIHSFTDVIRLAMHEPDLWMYISYHGRRELAFLTLIILFWCVFLLWLSYRSRRLMLKAWLMAMLFPIVTGGPIPYIVFFISPYLGLVSVIQGFDGEEWSDGVVLWLASNAWLMLCIGMAIRGFIILRKERNSLIISNETS